MVLRRLWVIVLFALALAACGNDGPSKEEFIAQGDKLCRDYITKGEAMAEPESEEEIVQLLDDVIALLQETRDDFRALKAPGDGEAVQRAIVASMSEGIDRVRDARDAAARGDQAGMVSALDAADESGGRADPEARAYGFKDCAEEEPSDS